MVLQLSANIINLELKNVILEIPGLTFDHKTEGLNIRTSLQFTTTVWLRKTSFGPLLDNIV